MARTRSAEGWLALLGPGGALRERLERAHAGTPYLARLLATYRAVLETSAGRFGPARELFLVRVPARVNLLGTHIDHRGGSINPIAVREMVIAAAPRRDSRIEAVNVEEAFPPGGFSIAGELPPGPVEDWEAWTREALRERAGREDAGPDWLNYLRAAVLYLQNWCRLHRPDLPPLGGADLCIGSVIPTAAGLSSSSALVVGAMLAAAAVNRLDLPREDMVEMCGEAEWYVGTRGGKGDHAAILFGRQGHVLHIGFWPLRIESAPLPKGYAVVLANSLKEAKKQAGAKDAFNQRVAAYAIGQVLLRRRFPGHAARIRHLRDVTPARLGVSEGEVYRMLLALPVRAGRREILRLAAHPDDRRRLAAVFQTHAEPPAGYPVRQVVLYAISECLRSEMALERLEAGDAEGFGELMNLSHEGDRVSRLEGGGRVPVDHTPDDATLLVLAESADRGEEQAALWRRPGGYDASCPELDELVDIARAVEGVVGAGLVGAGLGGAVAVLCREEAVKPLADALAAGYYRPRGLEPAVETCTPVAGAEVIDLP